MEIQVLRKETEAETEAETETETETETQVTYCGKGYDFTQLSGSLSKNSLDRLIMIFRVPLTHALYQS